MFDDIDKILEQPTRGLEIKFAFGADDIAKQMQKTRLNPESNDASSKLNFIKKPAA